MASTAPAPVLDDVSTAAAVGALITARTTGRLITGLPHPVTTEAAFAIQDAVRDHLGAEIGGWKCALPRDNRIIAAPIFASDMQHEAQPVIVRTPYIRWEPELAFTLSRDVSRGANRADIIDAIGETRLALELLHGRYSDPNSVTPTEILADNLYNEGLLLGPVIDPDAVIATITIRDSKGAREFTASHPAVDPLAPLIWLANEGPHPLKAGMTFITGSFIAPQTLAGNATIEVGFGTAGSLIATFQFEDRSS